MRYSCAPVFDRNRLLQLTEAMKGKLVVVYGDIVADRFIYGTPKRIWVLMARLLYQGKK